jgi:hypothetical protein
MGESLPVLTRAKLIKLGEDDSLLYDLRACQYVSFRRCGTFTECADLQTKNVMPPTVRIP